MNDPFPNQVDIEVLFFGDVNAPRLIAHWLFTTLMSKGEGDRMQQTIKVV